MSNRAVNVCGRLLATATLFCPALWAQGVTSDIRGTVTDTSGAAVVGATVTLDDVTKGLTRTNKSDSSGNYEFLQLPPADTFTVNVEFAGFKKEVRSGIVLQTGQQSRVDLTLTPGDVAESVTVQENASLVQSEESQVGAVVDERKVKELPLNGRQFWQLSQLVPNVLPPAQNSNIGFRGGFNVSGHQEVENNYILDGVDNVDQTTMQPTNRPSVDGIQEFKVLTGVYNAEYGRYPGGQILITTKAGGNDFHGTVYEFLRNSALDARNFFSPPTIPSFRRNQFGASNGGRIIRNRTFYFATYEGLRLTDQVTALTTVPTPAEESGNFAGQAAIKDPLTGAAFPGNIIPSSRFNPISVALLQYWPAPTSPGLANNYLFSQLGNEQDNQFSGRIDQIVTSKNNLFVSYQFAQRTTFWQDNSSCGGRVVPGFGCYEPERDQAVSINDTHVFSATMVNELRIGFNRIRTDRLSQDVLDGNVSQALGISYLGNIPQGTVSKLTDIPSLASGTVNFGNLGLPVVTVSGLAVLGGGTNTMGRRTNTYNIIDGFSWIKGSHTFKFGVDYKRFIYNYSYLAMEDGKGNFTFNGQYTGSAFADYMLGDQRTTSVTPGDPTLRYRQTEDGFYFQDEWKATARLTLSYGIRYELPFPFTENLNQIATFDRATGLLPTANGNLFGVNAASQLVNVGASTIGNTVWHLETKDFAPRFGFAFRPFDNDKTVVRGGYGIYYNANLGTGSGVSSLSRTVPFRAAQTYTNTPTQLIATWGNAFPTGVGAAVGGYNPYGINPNIRTPYAQQWTFGIERELVKDLILETTYLGSKGSELVINTNINQPVPGPGAIQSRRPYPQWGSITWVNSVGNSSYNSLAVRLERRYSNGLSMLLAYTYSHSIDDGGGSGDGEAAIQNPLNLKDNRGSSPFDIQQRLVASIVYELPFGTGKPYGSNFPAAVRGVISGWEMSDIITSNTGPPFSVTTSTDISNTGATARPNVVGNPVLSNPTPAEWFNTAAFSIAEPAGTYSYGNAGRNLLRADGIQNIDFGLFRNFKIRERFSLQFRSELFNILNHPDFGLPVGNFNASNFGSVTQTSTSSRQVQFSIKIVF